jgi:hypothetical protein
VYICSTGNHIVVTITISLPHLFIKIIIIISYNIIGKLQFVFKSVIMSANVAVVKKLKMSKNAVISRASSDGDPPQPPESGEDIKLLYKDLKILEKKMMEVQGLSIQPESVFVSGVRSNVESSAIGTQHRESALRLHLLEKIVSNIVDLDREILKKTAPAVATRARRNSRGGGQDSDLHVLPTHLTILDRLVDFHTQLQREPIPVIVQTSSSDGREDITTSALENELGTARSENTRLTCELEALRSELSGIKNEVAARPPSVPVEELDRYKDMASSLKDKLKHCEGRLNMSETQLEVLREQETAVVQTLKCQTIAVENITSRTPQSMQSKGSTSDINNVMVRMPSIMY